MRRPHLWAISVGIAAIMFVAVKARAEDPVAKANPSDVTTAGATSYSFVVHYMDDGEIDTSTIDSHDVVVTGPNGFDVPATLVGFDTSNGVDASYSIVPPGGSWDAADNGAYTLVMQPKQVTDMLRNPVKAGPLASFNVSISASAAPAQLLNISTRGLVQNDENVLIGGFIVSESAAKKVIARAIGPSLTAAGVANALSDPMLELHAGSSVLALDNNWKDTQPAEIQGSGVAPGNDFESAIVATLPANNAAYTAIVRGANNGTGVGLVELYDLDTSVDSKLANISTRGPVFTDTNVMIGGFILGSGTGAANILVRGLGPSLASAGVNGVLADPMLELHDANGTLVQANADWQDTQAAAIQNTGIPPTNNLESAIVATLAPGSYTAVLAGKNGGTGVGLVEIYHLP